MAKQPVIAVDLDGTLAKLSGRSSPGEIGEPVRPMVALVQTAIARGARVVIFTARVAGEASLSPINRQRAKRAAGEIQDWLEAAGLPRLTVTAVKTDDLLEFWDDRAVRVERDTGRFLAELENKPERI